LKASIFCPGQSLTLQSFDRPQSDYGLCIAVNGAILIPFTIFAYWAIGDPELFKTCIEKMDGGDPRTKLWTYVGFGRPSAEPQAGWTQTIRAEFSRRTKVKFDRESLPLLVNLGADRSWYELTFFTAIALAVLKQADKITVYGADFSGSGYFLPELVNRRTDHTPVRWERERRLWDQAVDACHRQNIILERPWMTAIKP
jgi:hypothetical protein